LRIRQTGDVEDAEQTGRDIDSVIDGIGARLRSLRRTRAMTLADVAEATGTSQSTLSRMESGARRPSLDLLLRLARTYRVNLDELVDAPDTGDPRIHARPSVRYGVTWVPLTRRAGGLHAFKLVIPGGFPAGEPEQRSHEGYEWMYVLDGRLRLLLGEHDMVLTPGEVAEFDTHTPHAFTNPADTPTELLILISAQGQRAHVRARPARSAPNPTGRP
jgi:transcriptional regulator with XRE-family HTH domain